MVRYSKLAFRTLVRLYDVDVAFSPMILADSFHKSPKARDNELTIDPLLDDPLIVQFAANNGEDLAKAALLVQNDCRGVDLNCGCPQAWACREGIGASLVEKPEIIVDAVKRVKSVCKRDLSVSVKIRLHPKGLKRTVDLVRAVEAAGADFITVHGRTRFQRPRDPVDYAAIGEVVKSVQIPVVANGDINTLNQAKEVARRTGVTGVMSARGVLANPAMFSGFEETPRQCVDEWVRIALETGTSFSCFHHHLIYMHENSLSRAERKIFNSLSSTSSVLDFLAEMKAKH